MTENSTVQNLVVPDIGDFSGVTVIEIGVHPGVKVEREATLFTLETDKATMDVPSPLAGVIKTFTLKVGDKVSRGDVIGTIETEGIAPRPVPLTGVSPVPGKIAEPPPVVSDRRVIPDRRHHEPVFPGPIELSPITVPPQGSKIMEGITKTAPVVEEAESYVAMQSEIHAGPGVRQLARALNIDLTTLAGSGRGGRIIQNDLAKYIKQNFGSATGSGGASDAGLDLEPWPVVDFTKFGAVKVEPLSRIQKISSRYLHRNWVRIPHVTQFESADITDLENFRQVNKQEAEQRKVKLTLLAFLIKAVVATLKKFPQFNASLDSTGDQLVIKQYYNIGVAVDTPNGLVVPVVRNADSKTIWELTTDLMQLSSNARQGKLSASDIQGGSFSISSLGGVGGTSFTPIINAPEVAILGVSRADLKVVEINGQFVSRLFLPLSLSFDHRVIDGASAARFTTHLAKCLTDFKNVIM